jgi:hypoxanthine-DNA glycosylase
MTRDPDAAEGFPPVFAANAEILILGSMPGVRSLERQQYYAHPRNAFWPIMQALCGIDARSPYQQRLDELRAHRIALWDVIASCRRSGSLDQRIEAGSVVANDFAGLLAECRGIRRIGFNGAMAATAWRRHVAPALSGEAAAVSTVRLPSTSPAHAAMSFDDKLHAWRSALSLPVA